MNLFVSSWVLCVLFWVSLGVNASGLGVNESVLIKALDIAFDLSDSVFDIPAFFEFFDENKGRDFSWRCQSLASYDTGACSSENPVQSNVDMQGSIIKVRLKEEQTQATIDLTARGRKIYVCEQTGARDYAKLDTYLNDYCGGGNLEHVRVELSISKDELKKIPTGGIWKGRICLSVYSLFLDVPDGIFDHEEQLNITLTVTDRHNATIYFVNFSNPIPQIDLNLQQNGNTMSGRTFVEFCVYNGSNTTSTVYSFKLTDDYSPGSGRRLFSVRHESGASSQAARIDYHIFLEYNTRRIRNMLNGIKKDFRSRRMWSTRNDLLSFRGYRVMCMTASLILQTPAFNPTDKMAGHYKGKLHIEFSFPP